MHTYLSSNVQLERNACLAYISSVSKKIGYSYMRCYTTKYRVYASQYSIPSYSLKKNQNVTFLTYYTL